MPDLVDIPGAVFEFYTPPGTYFDLFPIHMLTTSTLQFMSQLNPAAIWDVRRFRPNVLVDTLYHGQPLKLLLHAVRNGFFYVFDRTKG